MIKFGTSGLRGLASDLTCDICQAYTVAFLQFCQERGDLGVGGAVLIGMDLRPHSPLIATYVARAAHQFGIKIENCGALPTPALALAALSRGCPAIMVTGSHIPADRNGLKFYKPDGEIDKQDEQAICQKLEQVLAQNGSRFERYDHDVFLPTPSKEALEAYKTRAECILPDGMLRGMTIGIYQQSSVARDILGEILGVLGANIIPFGRSESFIAIDTEALDDETRSLTIKAAQSHHLDAIVSTDGDGDRPLIAGSNGVYLRGDVVGLLCAQFLKADCVVTPVTSCSLIEQSCLFKKIYRCRVGSPYVLACMAQASHQSFNAIIGFEANGGVLLGSDIMLDHGTILPKLATRDAILPILAILGLAQKRRVLVQDLSAFLPARFTASGRLENVAATITAQFLEHLAEDTDRRHDFCQNFGSIWAQDRIDGLRLMLDKGDILHYRASGNAPELRCYSEASSVDEAEALVSKGLAYARKQTNLEQLA